MTQAEKLEALVQRAIENGWQYPNHDHIEKAAFPDDGKKRRMNWYIDEVPALWVALEYKDNVVTEWQRGAGWRYDRCTIIFSHDFARALFGEKPFYVPSGSKEAMQPVQLPEYLVRLQQAVISKDPIDYMHKAVFGETA